MHGTQAADTVHELADQIESTERSILLIDVRQHEPDGLLVRPLLGEGDVSRNDSGVAFATDEADRRACRHRDRRDDGEAGEQRNAVSVGEPLCPLPPRVLSRRHQEAGEITREIVGELFDLPVPILAIFGERSHHDRCKILRDSAVELGERDDRSRAGRLAREHVIENRS